MKHITDSAEQFCQTDEPYLDVSSLIDVCFLLLIFFLLTTTIVKKEHDLNMDLPFPGESSSSFSPLVVHIERGGQITVNPDLFPEIVATAESGSELPLLVSRLDLLTRSQGARATVQLRVDSKAGYQRFIDVMNCLTQSGIEHTAIIDF